MKDKVISRVKAVREKCMDCCCWESTEVRRCNIVKCPLHPFRMGTIEKSRQANDKEGIKSDY